MKAIIEKQVIMQPVRPGYVINGVTDKESVIVIKLFSIPIYRKEIIIRKQT